MLNFSPNWQGQVAGQDVARHARQVMHNMFVCRKFLFLLMFSFSFRFVLISINKMWKLAHLIKPQSRPEMWQRQPSIKSTINSYINTIFLLLPLHTSKFRPPIPLSTWKTASFPCTKSKLFLLLDSLGSCGLSHKFWFLWPLLKSWRSECLFATACVVFVCVPVCLDACANFVLLLFRKQFK